MWVWYALAFYIWIMFMFGWWYFYPKALNEWKIADDGSQELSAFVCSLLVTPIFWPLIIAYALRDRRKKEAEALRRLQDDAGIGGKGIRC
jgi:hypothetical protein